MQSREWRLFTFYLTLEDMRIRKHSKNACTGSVRVAFHTAEADDEDKRKYSFVKYQEFFFIWIYLYRFKLLRRLDYYCHLKGWPFRS